MRSHKRWWGHLVLTLMIGLMGSNIAWSQADESLEAQLKLTQQQKEQITQLREKFKADAAPIQAKIKTLQQKRAALEADGASNDAISAVLEEKASQEIKLAMLLRKFKQNYLKILTEEQIQLLQSLKKG